MVQMYAWLAVAIVLAAGVLVLAVAATRGDGSGRGGPRTLSEAVEQAWRDFRSGLATLRARLTLGATRGEAAPRARECASVAGAPSRVSVLPGGTGGRSGGAGLRPATDAWSLETPQDTSIEDFFAATQTSEPAYLDTAQVSDVLLRRR